MIKIKILGPGCANCKRVDQMVRKLVGEMGLEAEIEKVTDFGEVMKYNILTTPGLVINDKLVSSGRIPSLPEVREWLEKAGA